MASTFTSSSDSGMSSTKDFVLKLRLVGADGNPEIRRVRLSRISNADGEVSYDALLQVAIGYSFPNSIMDAQNYQVLMTYYDVDNDCVTIASTEELLDAIEQFSTSTNKVLRVTTDIKLKEGGATTSRGSAQAASNHNDQDQSSAGRAVQLQNVLDSFVSVLAAAIVTVQNQVVHVNSHVSEDSDESHPVASETTTDVAAEMTEFEEELANRVVGNIGMDQVPANAEQADEAATETTEPFIHGRHTCDTCLCTPIVGNRFHSTNLPDYDLCENCHTNYKGTEIQFETAELDRDRPFQVRWQRKHALFEKRGPCRPQGRGSGGRHRGARGGCHPPRGPRGRHHGRHHGRRYGNQFRWQPEQQPETMEAALSEAIRRSLEDVDPEESAKPEPSAPPEEPTESQQTAEAAAVAIVEAFEEEAVVEDINAVTVEDATQVEEEQEQVNVVVAPVQRGDCSFADDAIGNGETAEEIGVTLDNVAQAIDDMVSELTEKMHEQDYTVEDGSQASDAITTDEGKVGTDNCFLDEQSSKSSEDEWQVVSEDDQVVNDGQTIGDDQIISDGQTIGGDQIISDEMLARATQLIGSSLFESDIRSDEPCSVVGSSDTFSVPSSVPTVAMDAQISSTVLDRWEVQLSQLHELGFLDDTKNVECLERLCAANIGVDSEEDISVTQVVNEILNV